VPPHRADALDVVPETGPAHLHLDRAEAAAETRVRLGEQTIERELDENRTQLEQAEKTYKDLVRARDVAINAARTKIESLKSGINDLKMKRALAELTEMASGMITNIGSSGETLDRLHTIVEEERSKAAGRARVARDTMDTSGVMVKEAEQKALADQALADFAAKEGIPLDIAAPAETGTPESAPTKTMGPAGMEKA